MTTDPTPFAMKSPLDGAPLSDVEATPIEEVKGVVDHARKAQEAWAGLSLEERIDALRKVKDRTLDRAEEIAKKVHAEIGRPEIEVLLGEVLPTADVVAYWAESIEELLDPIEVGLDKLSYPGKSGLIHREPRGVIGLIAPWNMPVAIPLRTIIPALLAGNAVVLNPSEVSPRAGEIVESLFEGLVSEGLVGLVQGAGEAGGALVDADVDAIVFTGSV